MFSYNILKKNNVSVLCVHLYTVNYIEYLLRVLAFSMAFGLYGCTQVGDYLHAWRCFYFFIPMAFRHNCGKENVLSCIYDFLFSHSHYVKVINEMISSWFFLVSISMQSNFIQFVFISSFGFSSKIITAEWKFSVQLSTPKPFLQ